MDDWDDLVEPARSALETLISKGDAMADRIEELEAQLEAAFYEGFCAGRDGGWVGGNPTPAWKNSDTLAELKGQEHGN